MAALNKWLGMGRLTADPQRGQTTASNSIATFIMAINEPSFKAEGDATIKATTFVPVVAFGKLAEAVLTYLTKGRDVLVEGKLEIDSSIICDHGKHSRPSIRAENIQFLGSRDGGTTAKQTTSAEPSVHRSS